jgi:hypothetical protein
MTTVEAPARLKRYLDRLHEITAATGAPPASVWMEREERSRLVDELLSLAMPKRGDARAAVRDDLPVKVHGVPVCVIEVLPPAPRSKSAEDIRREKYG